MPDPAVHVEGVVKRFRATTALAGVDLDVEEGTVFGLLGPNGAGKTTLVRVLATLLSPDAGRAEVFGRDVVQDPAGVRELLGLTGQFAAVDEMLTGRENLQMFGRLFDLSVADARRQANDLLAEQIAVIDHGRMIAQGTGSELKDRVGGQILEVELVSAAERDTARAALAGIGCGEPEPGDRLAQLTLPAPRDGLEMIEDAASALRKAEIAVSDLGLRRPTLDDGFLQLTGAPPSENGAGAGVGSGDGQPHRTGLSPRAARAPAALRPGARRASRCR